MTPAASRRRATFPSQALLAKIFHWVNIISLLVMITSGLQIYNANPVFGGRAGWHFPKFLLLGGWLAGGRDWHFAAMWVYSLNLLWYGLYVFITRRWRHRFASSSDLKALKASKNPKRTVYAWHRLVYTAIVPILLLSIASGLAMYRPVQFYWLSELFGSWQALRTVHFLAIPTVIIFVILHSVLALKSSGLRLIKSMFI